MCPDRTTRYCIVCEEELPPDKRSDAKYCSSICGNKYRGKIWRDANKDKIKQKNARENSHAEKTDANKNQIKV